MATEQPGFNLGSEVAAADLSAAANQFKVVKMTSTGINLCTVSGEKVVGILQNKPASGKVADVMVCGKSKAVIGAAVAKGALLMTNASGQVITAATAGSTIIGWALEAGTNAGEIISIMLMPAAGVV